MHQHCACTLNTPFEVPDNACGRLQCSSRSNEIRARERSFFNMRMRCCATALLVVLLALPVVHSRTLPGLSSWLERPAITSHDGQHCSSSVLTCKLSSSLQVLFVGCMQMLRARRFPLAAWQAQQWSQNATAPLPPQQLQLMEAQQLQSSLQTRATIPSW
jgi:hypothetical protein